MKYLLLLLSMMALSCSEYESENTTETNDLINLRNGDYLDTLIVPKEYEHVGFKYDNLPKEIKIDSTQQPYLLKYPDLENEVFVTLLTNREERLISAWVNDEMKHLFLYSVNDSIASYNHIESNTPFLIIDHENGSYETFDSYGINGGSTNGEPQALAGCLGGSVLGCITLVFEAIDSDLQLWAACIWMGGFCPAAVVISCTIHCLK